MKSERQLIDEIEVMVKDIFRENVSLKNENDFYRQEFAEIRKHFNLMPGLTVLEGLKRTLVNVPDQSDLHDPHK